ncbi:MAG TPA: sensor histidine kinase [Ktedonobacterales bacterium]
MNALRRRFATLRWRLMLTCFVSAFTAMMTLAVVFFLLPGIVALFTPQRPLAMAHDLVTLARRVTPLYARTPPDSGQLLTALGAYEDKLAIVEGLTNNTRGEVGLIPGKNAAIYALDGRGQTLARLTPGSASPGDFATLSRTVATLAVTRDALRGTSQPGALVRVLPDGLTVAAAPVVGADGKVAGALLIAADMGALVRPIYLADLAAILPTALFFAAIASVFGAVFGILTARGLTRRVQRLTEAAAAWSQGDFTATARDPSEDELGRLARDLNAMAERLRQLLRDQQRLAVIEERNRLARDLHDSVKQQLFALTMLVGGARLEVGNESAARRILDQAESVATSAQAEMTALIQALRPAPLINRGLGMALHELCGEWEQRHGIACALETTGAVDLDPTVEQEVYRVVQEALANIAKHSGATRVDVRAVMEGDALSLRIRDNGHGFHVERASGRGLGLSSMRERVAALGGTLRISSSVGGTSVETRIPLGGRTPGAVAAGEAPGGIEPEETNR